MKIARKYLPPVALLLVSTIGVAYAATTLFTQTFPAIPATVAVTGGTVTPTFSLPTGYTSLFVWTTQAAFPGCQLVPTLTQQLTSGSPNSFESGSNTLDYCANYSNAPSTG